MIDSRDFLMEYGQSIVVTLRNVKLTEKTIQQRFSFLKAHFKTTEESDVLRTLENRIKDIMVSTGKDIFSEDEIDVALRSVLGLESREYDKNYLIEPNKGEIIKTQGHLLSKKMRVAHEYGNTTITPLGYVTASEWNGTDNWSGITFYIVSRFDKHRHADPYIVFSNIDFDRMDTDMEYREAVLYALLEDKNILKTNCGGYVGTIHPKSETGNYTEAVKANNKYDLVFDSTAANTISEFRKKPTAKNKEELQVLQAIFGCKDEKKTVRISDIINNIEKNNLQGDKSRE